ncbi:MAG: MBL fold metallo-hydrolase [Acidobacteriia bacterium]|nr:MBL fold metallo-hydrolase [Terriglobia bacterium]
MVGEINRRDFLVATVAAGTALIAGDAMAGEHDAPVPLKIPEMDRIVVTIITDNYYDALRPDAAATKRYRIVPGTSMHAEHGLSYFLETLSNGKTSGFVFDYGLDGRAVKANMDLLGLDVGKAVAFGLSHGHFDHWSGLLDIVRLNQEKIPKGTPLFVGGEAFDRRFAIVPGTKKMLDIGRLNRAEVEALGLLQVTEVKSPTEVMPSGFFTGNIDRVTEYEKANKAFLVQRGDAVVIDAFPGEQAMVVHLKNRGLVVLSSCAHSGIVNTFMHAQKITGLEKVYAVVGGFHLINAKPEVIERTVADIKALKPEVVVPAHCTGFEATTLFAREMPRQFILNTAGTRYTFSA